MANDGSKQFFDVVRPGKSAANATSKPIIVGNRPIIKDPMFNTEPKQPPEEYKKNEDTDKPTEPPTKTSETPKLESSDKLQDIEVEQVADTLDAPKKESEIETLSDTPNQNILDTEQQSSDINKTSDSHEVTSSSTSHKATNFNKLLFGLGMVILVGVVAAVTYIVSGTLVK